MTRSGERDAAPTLPPIHDEKGFDVAFEDHTDRNLHPSHPRSSPPDSPTARPVRAYSDGLTGSTSSTAAYPDPDLDPITPMGHHHHPAQVKEADGEVVTFPDGGIRAWLVVFGAMHILFSTFGFVNAWGLFQDYYAKEMFPDKSPSQVAWIGSLQYLLIYFPSVVMGRLVDTSKFYWPFWVASVLYPLSAFLTAQVKEYWQVVLAHGLLFGGAAGILFCPAIAVVTQWFYNRRAFALGVVAASSSLGGTFFPIIVHNCLKAVGFQWTMRICGFIMLYCCILASVLLRTRLPPKTAPGGVFNWPAFKIPSFSIFVLGTLLVQGGLYTPLSYVDVMASERGMGDYSSYLVSIANAASILGRMGPALFADHVGSLNLLLPGLVGSAVSTYAWPFCTTKASLTVISIINGIFQGCYVSLLAPAVASLGGVEDVGRRFGMVSSMMALGSLLGAPVSGELLRISDFHGVSYYAGTIVLLGSACMAAGRYLYLGQWRGKL